MERESVTAEGNRMEGESRAVEVEGESVTGEEKANSSWVVEVEKMLVDCRPFCSVESERWEAQSIYRVPEWMKNMNNIKAYRPQVLALGPFHHEDPDLQPMEEHKRRAVAHLVKRGRKPIQAYIAAVEEVAEQLEAAYGKDLGDKWRGRNRHRFVEVMVTDGCFLLELLMGPRQDYAPNDLVFGHHGSLYMSPFIRSDVLMLENQLPLLVLKRLLVVQNPDRYQSATMDNIINSVLLQFLSRTSHGPLDVSRLHPLDLYHSSLIYDARQDSKSAGESVMPCELEIHEAGIHFRKSETDSLLDVHFKDGVLSMPELTVDDEFEAIFLNLMAFERLHAKAGNDVTAYVFFMDNIIDSGKDVGLPRSKGIFQNYLGSDKAVAKLVNDTLSKGAVLSPSSTIDDVQQQVKDHCKKPWNKWRANFMHTYLRNPWVFISLVAAAVLLLATLTQTVYTIMPFYQKMPKA